MDHFRAGDRALIAAVTSCGKCHACRIRRMPSLCEAGGWTLGNTVDGTQARPARLGGGPNEFACLGSGLWHQPGTESVGVIKAHCGVYLLS